MTEKQGRPKLYGESLKTLQVGLPISVYQWIVQQAHAVNSTVAATTRAIILKHYQEAAGGRTEAEPTQD